MSDGWYAMFVTNNPIPKYCPKCGAVMEKVTGWTIKNGVVPALNCKNCGDVEGILKER